MAFWSYDLLREVRDRDVVLHYDRDLHAIVAWSRAVGTAWPDQVIWAARGTFARGRNIQPHERPGMRVSLEGAFRLGSPVTLQRVREEQERLLAIRRNRAYFPFELGSRATRPMQGYLFKLPLAFVELFPELESVPRFTSDGVATASGELKRTGDRATDDTDRPAFVPRDENVRSQAAKPWSRDPSEVDRALSAHARIERLVAEAAAAKSWTARAHGADDPPFDLLLEPDRADSPFVVVEVKSSTRTNEEKQLRLALGQVLRYCQLMRAGGAKEVGFIAIENEPRDPSWHELCTAVGVTLVWPATVSQALADLIP